jgi:hypothetical protein
MSPHIRRNNPRLFQQVLRSKISFRVEYNPGDLKKGQKSEKTDHLEGVRNEECSG